MIEVNGQQYQHGTSRFSVSTGASTQSLKTTASVKYKVSAKKDATNDSQGQVDGFVIKKAEHDASIKLKLSEWLNVLRPALLAANPGLGVLQCAFDLKVSYGNKVNAMKVDWLRGTMVQEDARESTDGQDVDMVELPLFFLKGEFADGPAIVYE